MNAITGPQLRKLHAVYRERDADRDTRLASLAAMLNRPITSALELSQDEASFVIDALCPKDPGLL